MCHRVPCGPGSPGSFFAPPRNRTTRGAACSLCARGDPGYPPGVRSTLRLLAFASTTSVLALTQTGCAKKPTMKLNHAEISGLNVGFPPSLAVVLTSVVDVYNPNSYDVAVRAMRGQITIMNRYTLPLNYVAENNGVWLAAGRTTSMRVPVSIPVDVALQLARETLMTPTIQFHVVGKADVTASRTFQIEKDDYSVNETGSFQSQSLQLTLGGMGLNFSLPGFGPTNGVTPNGGGTGTPPR